MQQDAEQVEDLLAVPTSPGNTMIACATGDRDFDVGSDSRLLEAIGFGDSAAMMPGSVMPM